MVRHSGQVNSSDCTDEWDRKLETHREKEARAEIKTAKPGCFEQLIQPLWLNNNRLPRWPCCYSVLLHDERTSRFTLADRGTEKEDAERVERKQGSERRTESTGPHRHVFCVVLNYVASRASIMKRYRLIIQPGSWSFGTGCMYLRRDLALTDQRREIATFDDVIIAGVSAVDRRRLIRSCLYIISSRSKKRAIFLSNLSNVKLMFN